MKMEDRRKLRTLGWPDQTSCPVMDQDSQERRQADASDNATDDNILCLPTPQPVWPRIWPGL